MMPEWLNWEMVRPLELVGRLVLAGVLGGLVGLDREYRAKEAGLRTHFLVAVGCALMMLVSMYGFQEFLAGAAKTGGLDLRLDPSRVAAQIVSGIGFIGAGTIIFQKQSIKGLTTAAGLWTVAGIGMAVGGGLYTLAITATILTLIGLELLSKLFGRFGLEQRSFRVSFLVNDNAVIIKTIEELQTAHAKVLSYSAKREDDMTKVTMLIRAGNCSSDESSLLIFLQKLPDLEIKKLE